MWSGVLSMLMVTAFINTDISLNIHTLFLYLYLSWNLKRFICLIADMPKICLNGKQCRPQWSRPALLAWECLSEYLRGLNTLGRFSSLFYKRAVCDFLFALDNTKWPTRVDVLFNTNTVKSCLLSCRGSPSSDGVCSKRKEFAPHGRKFFPFRVDPFSEGRRYNSDQVVSLESVSSSFKVSMVHYNIAQDTSQKIIIPYST